MYNIQPTEELKAIAELTAMNTHAQNALGQLQSFTKQAYDVFWFGEASPNLKASLLGTQALKVFTDSAEVQGFLAVKIAGYTPLGVPEGYSVNFAQDGSAEIIYTPPVIEEEPEPEEEPIPE